MWVIGYYHLIFFIINFFLKSIFYLKPFVMLTIYDTTIVQVQKSFTKTKTQN
jgi:hypothetical protein